MLEAHVAPSLPRPPPSARRPRLGFAGVGWIGRNRLDALAAGGGVEIAAVADPAPELAQQVAEAHHCNCVAGTFEDLLPLDLDGIVIATPSALHATQAEAALRAGKAVFCQKPLARTAAETTAIVEAARQADRLLGVDLSYRHTRGMQAIQDLVATGQLGEIYAIEATFHNAYGPDKPWFYDARLSGGGCLLDLGIHLVDLALWTLGFPEVETARGRLLSGGRPLVAGGTAVEDYAAAQVLLRGGASLQIACSWRLAAGCDARIEISFHGTQGGASMRNVGGSFLDFVAERFLPDRSRQKLAEPPDPWGGRAALAWARQLAVSSHFDPEVAHVCQVARVLDAIYGR